MKYASLYEYLDVAFAGKNPSESDIIQAKKMYWRMYFREYRKQRRKIKKEFTLSFDTSTLAKINAQKGDVSTSQYLYCCVFESLEGKLKPIRTSDKDIGQIQQYLMTLISLLEETLERHHSELTQDILIRFEELELQFDQFLKS